MYKAIYIYIYTATQRALSPTPPEYTRGALPPGFPAGERANPQPPCSLEISRPKPLARSCGWRARPGGHWTGSAAEFARLHLILHTMSCM